MRRIDKTKNMVKANLLAEQRYLQSKGFINEFIAPLSDGSTMFAEGEEELPKNLDTAIEAAGVNPDDVDTIKFTDEDGNPIKTVELSGNLEEGKVTDFVMKCVVSNKSKVLALGLAAALVTSCSKEGKLHGYNTNVHGVEYTVVGDADENTTLTPEEEQQGIEILTVTGHNGQARIVKAKFLKDQQGNSSGAWAFKEEPSQIEFAIHGFGQTKVQEARTNISFNKGDKIADYTYANPSKQPYSSNPLKTIRDSQYFKDAIWYISQGEMQKQDFNNDMQKKGIGITAEDAINMYGKK